MKYNMQEIREIIINAFIGKKVTKVTAGGGNGSVVILRFGENLFSLFIYCIWRLEENNKIVTGWNESCDAETGNLTKQIKLLLNDEIKKTEVSNLMDIKIYFVSGKVLNIFCDITPMYEPKEYDENWVISDIANDISYRFKSSFEIEICKYS